MRVGLVGAGPAALCALEGLVRAHAARGVGRPALDVVAFDAGPWPWRGTAYGPDLDEALSNSHLADTSPRPWDRDHGERWMRTHGHARYLPVEAFAPRAVLGRYLRACAAETATVVDSFELVAEYVDRVVPGVDAVGLRTRDGVEWVMDAVVVCVGGTAHPDPYGLDGAPGFVRRAYPLRDTVASVGPREHVGVLGTGLTAVDVVAALEATGHRGPITLMSRHGLLPSVRRPVTPASPLVHFTGEAVRRAVRSRGVLSAADLVDLTRRELREHGGRWEWLRREVGLGDTGLVRLRRQVAERDDGDATHALLIRMTLAVHGDAWYHLPDGEKASLLRRFGHHKASLCCPMPHGRAAMLLRLADEGRLRVLAGVRGVVSSPAGGFRAMAADTEVRCDRLISGLVEVRGRPAAAQPLYAGLVRAGAVDPHPLGGVRVEASTCRVLDRRGRPQPRLYALGAPVTGALEPYIGLPLFTHRAPVLARAVLAGAGGRS